MIKLICISDCNSLTIKKIYINKIYDGVADTVFFGYYNILNDSEYLGIIHKDNFIPLTEYREKQIKTILDD